MAREGMLQSIKDSMSSVKRALGGKNSRGIGTDSDTPMSDNVKRANPFNASVAASTIRSDKNKKKAIMDSLFK